MNIPGLSERTAQRLLAGVGAIANGTLNKYALAESDGTVLAKAGTYFVNVAAKLNIASYTTGGAGFCALDLVHGTTGTKFVFEIFSPWSYPAPASNIQNAYPYNSSGMIRVKAKQAGFQLGLFCFDNAFTTVAVSSATWIVSPVSAASSAKAAIGSSPVGPAGFRPKPARE